MTIGRRYVLRTDFDEIGEELWRRVHQRLNEELPELAEDYDALASEDFQPIWDAAVDRILDEELERAERRLESVAGWRA